VSTISERRLLRLAAGLFFGLCLGAEPASAADAAPAAPREPSGFHLALRTGFGLPLGHYADVRNLASFRDSDVNALGDDTHGVIPVWIDAGYWLDPHILVGAYFMYGLVLPKTASASDPLGGGCPEGLDCFALGLRFGVQAQYRFAPGNATSPWLGLALGYEWISTQIEGELFSTRFEADTTHSGPDLLQLQGGVDFALSEVFALGPFAAVSAMQYTSCSLELAGEESDCEIEDGGWHGWLVFGVRGSLEP
jgi:hypothetical protein